MNTAMPRVHCGFVSRASLVAALARALEWSRRAPGV
jgi:hypothetical protein